MLTEPQVEKNKNYYSEFFVSLKDKYAQQTAQTAKTAGLHGRFDFTSSLSLSFQMSLFFMVILPLSFTTSFNVDKDILIITKKSNI